MSLPPAQPTDFVRQYAPWSISKLDVAALCPHKFYLQYHEKRKMGIPASSAALVGRAVHTLLEDITRGYKLEIARKLAVEMHELTTTEIESVDGFIPAALKFMSRIQAYRKRHDLGPLQAEQKWAIGFDGKPLGYWHNDVFLRGSVDLNATFNKKPYALVIDHKTGKQKELDAYAGQFAAYKLLLKAHKPKVQKVQTGINHLFSETVDMSKGLSDVRDITALLDDFIRYANTQTKTAYNHHVTRRSPLCDWCDYKAVCTAHVGHNGQKR